MQNKVQPQTTHLGIEMFACNTAGKPLDVTLYHFENHAQLDFNPIMFLQGLEFSEFSF